MNMTNKDVIEITKEQRDWILKYDEAQIGDVMARDIGTRRMSKKVSAFANADGGELWVGIDETNPPDRFLLGNPSIRISCPGPDLKKGWSKHGKIG